MLRSDPIDFLLFLTVFDKKIAKMALIYKTKQ